jgi:hypothetical protein
MRPDPIRPAAVVLAALIALAMSVPPAAAFSTLDRPFGSPEPGPSARQRALGGAGALLDPGAWALAGNPAALAGASGVRLQATGSLLRASENRFVPLFDTFDSYVDETAIAVNDHVYGHFSGAVSFEHPALRGVRLGLSTLERYDPRYDYFDERRTTATTDEIVAERFLRTRGTLRAHSAGFGLPLPRRLAAGAAVAWVRGTLEDRDALVSHSAAIRGRLTESTRELSGVTGTFGLAWDAGDRLRFGASVETSARMHETWSERLDDTLLSAPGATRHQKLPPRVLLSGTYRPRNALRSTFTVDALWTGWGGVANQAAPDEGYVDTWDVRLGLEHVYYQGLPGRIGFRYERAYASREADRAWFTFGAGWIVDRLRLDAAAEVGKRTSRQDPVWPREEQTSSVGAGRDRVEDTLVRFTLGAEVALR